MQSFRNPDVFYTIALPDSKVPPLNRWPMGKEKARRWHERFRGQ